MIKLGIGLLIVGVLAFGVMAYAHGPGWGGGQMAEYGYGGHMMGSGQGGHMMGQGYGGRMTSPMMGWRGSKDNQKFLDETADLRKELHNKKFEYFEAARNPDTKPETIAKLEKETREIQEKLYEKAPRSGYERYGGFGCNW
jgi:hypothetical protein